MGASMGKPTDWQTRPIRLQQHWSMWGELLRHGGMAHYPVAPNGTSRTKFYAEFDVPALPEKLDGICYYIYFNIFFGDSKPYGRMNQFPSQLILGEALDSSTGPPLYKPLWNK